MATAPADPELRTTLEALPQGPAHDPLLGRVRWHRRAEAAPAEEPTVATTTEGGQRSDPSSTTACTCWPGWRCAYESTRPSGTPWRRWWTRCAPSRSPASPTRRRGRYAARPPGRLPPDSKAPPPDRGGGTRDHRSRGRHPPGRQRHGGGAAASQGGRHRSRGGLPAPTRRAGAGTTGSPPPLPGPGRAGRRERGAATADDPTRSGAPAGRPPSRPACLRRGCRRRPHREVIVDWLRRGRAVILSNAEAERFPRAPGSGAARAVRGRRRHAPAGRALERRR